MKVYVFNCKHLKITQEIDNIPGAKALYVQLREKMVDTAENVAYETTVKSSVTIPTTHNPAYESVERETVAP